MDRARKPAKHLEDYATKRTVHPLVAEIAHVGCSLGFRVSDLATALTDQLGYECQPTQVARVLNSKRPREYLLDALCTVVRISTEHRRLVHSFTDDHYIEGRCWLDLEILRALPRFEAGTFEDFEFFLDYNEAAARQIVRGFQLQRFRARVGQDKFIRWPPEIDKWWLENEALFHTADSLKSRGFDLFGRYRNQANGDDVNAQWGHSRALELNNNPFSVELTRIVVQLQKAEVDRVRIGWCARRSFIARVYPELFTLPCDSIVWNTLPSNIVELEPGSTLRC